jgi:surface antigen
MKPRILSGVVLVALGSLLMTGCAETQGAPKTTVGALGGATVGGLIAAAAHGSPAAIAASVIGGGLVGGLIGNVMDQRDREIASKTTQQALETVPSGTAVPWTNPDNGHSGTVTPVRTYQAEGRYCREFQQTVTIGGKPEQSYGTACRQPDGSWKITN